MNFNLKTMPGFKSAILSLPIHSSPEYMPILFASVSVKMQTQPAGFFVLGRMILPPAFSILAMAF